MYVCVLLCVRYVRCLCKSYMEYINYTKKHHMGCLYTHLFLLEMLLNSSNYQRLHVLQKHLSSMEEDCHPLLLLLWPLVRINEHLAIQQLI